MLSEGWATPLTGFMREREYLQVCASRLTRGGGGGGGLLGRGGETLKGRGGVTVRCEHTRAGTVCGRFDRTQLNELNGRRVLCIVISWRIWN